MSIVILIGFSCSGKSTLRKRLVRWMKENAIERQIQFEDTDDVIAGEEDAIYRVFLNRVKRNGDRSEAMKFIQLQERKFLTTFAPSKPDCMIAAGPMLPLYPEWDSFVKRMDASCVWLTIKPEKAYWELRARQDGHANKTIDGKKLSEHWQFGCWNEGVVTYFHDSNRNWKLDLEEKCIENVSQLIALWSEVYQEYADVTLDFRSVRTDSDDAALMLKTVYALI